MMTYIYHSFRFSNTLKIHSGVFANPHSFLGERPTDVSLKYCIARAGFGAAARVGQKSLERSDLS